MMLVTLVWLWMMGYHVEHFRAGDPVPSPIVAMAKCDVYGRWSFGVDQWVASNETEAYLYGDISSRDGINVVGAFNCNLGTLHLKYRGMIKDIEIGGRHV